MRAHEEPILPAPLMRVNGTGRLEIDYQGEPLVQECMEYYIDKHSEEERLRSTILRRERLTAQARGHREDARSVRAAPRGVVTYLLMENSQRTLHRDLLLSLWCLGEFFGGYPVVVFHTNASTPEELALLRRGSPPDLALLFEEVELGFPPSIAGHPGGPDAFLAAPYCTMDGQHWWSTHRSCGCRCPAWRPQCWPLNWMHATRFFTAGMFRTRTFRSGDFDYFLRMDTDLFFVQRPDVDPFSLMADRGCAMVYDTISREAPGCHDGFDEMTLAFMNRVRYPGLSDEELLHVGHGPAAAGGQWTIGDARLFASESYLGFADFAAPGIYRDRWADQLLLMRGLALFGPRSSAPVGALEPAGVAPASAICIRPLFDAGTAAGFVHLKAGFRDASLLQRCRAPAWVAEAGM